MSYFYLVVEIHMLLNPLPCFGNTRENPYLWTCSRSKNQLVQIEPKQYFTQRKPKTARRMQGRWPDTDHRSQEVSHVKYLISSFFRIST